MNSTQFENTPINVDHFNELVGEDVVEFIFEHAPKKVTTRVAKSAQHVYRALALEGIDDEMGAIRLIAAEEELVVAIFEQLKLNADNFPNHKNFVGKFKNHVVKLSLYPVVQQFHWILGNMMKSFGPAGLEQVNWSARPVVDGKNIKLAILDSDGKEIIRHNPLAIDLNQGDVSGQDVVPLLLSDLVSTIQNQHGMSLKEFITERAHFRDKILYATDAGSFVMGDSLSELLEHFNETFRHLLWILAILLNADVPSKEWGLVAQLIGVYREVLLITKAIRPDNTVAELDLDEANHKQRV